MLSLMALLLYCFHISCTAETCIVISSGNPRSGVQFFPNPYITFLLSSILTMIQNYRSHVSPFPGRTFPGHPDLFLVILSLLQPFCFPQNYNCSALDRRQFVCSFSTNPCMLNYTHHLTDREQWCLSILVGPLSIILEILNRHTLCHSHVIHTNVLVILLRCGLLLPNVSQNQTGCVRTDSYNIWQRKYVLFPERQPALR